MINIGKDEEGSANQLAQGVEVVSIDNTANWAPENPLSDIFNFRGIGVQKLGWKNHIHFMDTPFSERPGECDNSDMLGTVYFVKRFQDRSIACVVRVHPAVDAYGRDISMIGKNLPHLVDDQEAFQEMLSGKYLETSRVIVNSERLPAQKSEGQSLSPRKQAVYHCLAASAFYTAHKGFKGFFCFMPTKIWDATYTRLGLTPIPLGSPKPMRDDSKSDPYDVYAGYMDFDQNNLRDVATNSGITINSLKYGFPRQSNDNQFLKKVLS